MSDNPLSGIESAISTPILRQGEAVLTGAEAKAKTFAASIEADFTGHKASSALFFGLGVAAMWLLEHVVHAAAGIANFII